MTMAPQKKASSQTDATPSASKDKKVTTEHGWRQSLAPGGENTRLLQ